MTGEWCQSPWSVTGSSGRISRTPLSCLPSILPLPIIVNQSGIVSTGRAVQQAIARAAGCREQQAPRLPATTPAQGHQGPLSRGCLGKMPQLKLKPFALRHTMHMAEKHGGVKPLEQLCVDKRSSWGPRCKHSFTGLSAGKQCCSLRRDRLVRKMT